MPESVGPYLPYLRDHLYVFVFLVTAVDALGTPFPGRLLLVTAGILGAGHADLAWLILAAAAGAVLGDHVLYVLGSLWGAKLLSLYCRWTLGSRRCVEQTREHFQRYGVMALAIGRFTFAVRIFATAIAGAGIVPYWQFLLVEVLGASAWAACFVLLGHVAGRRGAKLLERHAALVIGTAVGTALLAIVAWRLWKRRRYGGAQL